MSPVCVSHSIILLLPPSASDKKILKNLLLTSQITAVIIIIINIGKVAHCQSLYVLYPHTSCVVESLSDRQLVSR